MVKITFTRVEEDEKLEDVNNIEGDVYLEEFNEEIDEEEFMEFLDQLNIEPVNEPSDSCGNSSIDSSTDALCDYDCENCVTDCVLVYKDSPVREFNVNVELMLEKFNKHWISFKSVVESIELDQRLYLSILSSKVICLHEFLYYCICDAGQIDLSDCLVDDVSDLHEVNFDFE